MDSPPWAIALTSLTVAGAIMVLYSQQVHDAGLLLGIATIAVAMFLPTTRSADFGIHVGVEQTRGQVVVLAALAGIVAFWLRAAAPAFLALVAITVLTLLGDFLKGDAYVGDMVAMCGATLIVIACVLGAMRPADLGGLPQTQKVLADESSL